MKKTKVDKLGRIVIPISFREELDIQCGSMVVVRLENNSVVVRAERNSCKRCGDFIEENQKFPLCMACIEEIKNSYP